MFRLHTILIPVVALAVVSPVGTADAQQRQAKAQFTKGTGSLVNMRPGFLQIKDQKGQDYVLKVEAKPENILFKGKALAVWVQNGMNVRFEIPVDKKGNGLAPIESMTIFTPRPGLGLGISGGEAESNTGGAPFLDESEDDNTSDQPLFLIAGTVTKVEGNKLTVSVANTVVRAEMSEDIEIDLDVLGLYSFARRGEKLSYTGKLVGPNQVVANRLTFNAETPMGQELNGESKPNSE